MDGIVHHSREPGFPCWTYDGGAYYYTPEEAMRARAADADPMKQKWQLVEHPIDPAWVIFVGERPIGLFRAADDFDEAVGRTIAQQIVDLHNRSLVAP